MGDFSLQLLALLVVIFGLRSNRLIEFVRNLGGIGRGPGGPQHPLPVEGARPEREQKTPRMGNFYTKK